MDFSIILLIVATIVGLCSGVVGAASILYSYKHYDQIALRQVIAIRDNAIKLSLLERLFRQAQLSDTQREQMVLMIDESFSMADEVFRKHITAMQGPDRAEKMLNVLDRITIAGGKAT
jgi:hypothetical protein